MKCGAYIKKRTTKTGKPGKPKFIGHWFWRELAKLTKKTNVDYITNNKIEDYKDTVKCDGNIIADVYVDWDGCCNSSTSIAIQYKCDKCGNKFFKELPFSDYSYDLSTALSKYMTEQIENLSETWAKKKRKEIMDKEIESLTERGFING